MHNLKTHIKIGTQGIKSGTLKTNLKIQNSLIYLGNNGRKALQRTESFYYGQEVSCQYHKFYS